MKRFFSLAFLISAGLVLLLAAVLIWRPGIITAISTTVIAVFALRGLSDWKVQRKGDACAKAYYYFKTIDSLLVQADFSEVLAALEDQEDWFFSRRIFLPDTVMNGWLTLRYLARQHQRLKDVRIPPNPTLETEIEREMRFAIKDAIAVIYKFTGSSGLKVDGRGYDSKVYDYIRKSTGGK